MNNYELMVIFTPVLSDDEFKSQQKKIAKLVTDAGGAVVAENAWGLKSLAYPIQKRLPVFIGSLSTVQLLSSMKN